MIPMIGIWRGGAAIASRWDAGSRGIQPPEFNEDKIMILFRGARALSGFLAQSRGRIAGGPMPRPSPRGGERELFLFLPRAGG